jgi:hypothetical protein
MVGASAVKHTDAAGAPDRQLFRAPIAIRPAQTKWRDGGHHQPRIHLLHPIVAKTNAIPIGWPDIVNQNVGLLYQTLQERHPLSPGKIKRDAVLVGVEIKKEPTLLEMR